MNKLFYVVAEDSVGLDCFVSAKDEQDAIRIYLNKHSGEFDSLIGIFVLDLSNPDLSKSGVIPHFDLMVSGSPFDVVVD